uniref:protein FAM156A/FAM156B-like n=1 Tax=Jaculus jaculus TaxID=51337 RepID=UPI00064CFFBD|nr:protein FAM156A/FAM156B-like [Jaculus jaculus]
MEEKQWGSIMSLQKKIKLVEHKKQRSVKHVATYQADRKAKYPSSRDKYQKRFKCECHNCKKYTGNTSGISVVKKATSHSSSHDKLTQDLNNLTLNPSTTEPPLVEEMMQESE